VFFSRLSRDSGFEKQIKKKARKEVRPGQFPIMEVRWVWTVTKRVRTKSTRLSFVLRWKNAIGSLEFKALVRLSLY